MFHTPETISKALLGVTYPEIFHVSGAVWQARQAGLLEMPDKRLFTLKGQNRARLKTEMFYTTIADLMRLEAALAGCACQEVPFSIVLVDTVMWNGFDPGTRADLHGSPAGPGRVVLATEAAGLAGIVNGRLTLHEAADLGVVKLYGIDNRIEAFLNAHGDIGSQALPPVSHGQAFLRMVSSGSSARQMRQTAAPGTDQ